MQTERTLPELTMDLATQAGDLLRNEIRLARAEAMENFAQMGGGIVRAALGVALAGAAVTLGLFALAYALGEVDADVGSGARRRGRWRRRVVFHDQVGPQSLVPQTRRAAPHSRTGLARHSPYQGEHTIMSLETDRIEADLNQSRHRLNDTLEALGQKLSPGQMVDEVLGLAQGQAGEFASKLGRQVKDNPLPTLLIAAGVGMLLMNRNQSSDGKHVSAEDWRHDRTYRSIERCALVDAAQSR